MAACPHPLLLQLEKLCRAPADFYDGGSNAEACLDQVRLLLSTGKEADVLLLIKQQKLAQVLGQAVKHAFTVLFQHVHQLRAGSDIEDSIRYLLNIVHELFESCSQAGGADTATSSLLVARQLAESGMLANPHVSAKVVQCSSCNLQSIRVVSVASAQLYNQQLQDRHSSGKVLQRMCSL
jgi:hypothetical protein